MNREAGTGGVEEGEAEEMPNLPVSCLSTSRLLGGTSQAEAREAHRGEEAQEEDLVGGMVHLLLEEDNEAHRLHPLLQVVLVDSFLPGVHLHLAALEEELLQASSTRLPHLLLQEALASQAPAPPCLHQPLVLLKAGQLLQDLQLGVVHLVLRHRKDPGLSQLLLVAEEVLQCPHIGLLREVLGGGRTNLHQEDRTSCPTFWGPLHLLPHQAKKCEEINCKV